MTNYRHTQFGTFTIVAVGSGAFLALMVTLSATVGPAALGVGLTTIALVMAALVVFFWSLTVEVTDEHLRLWFGPGLIRKTFSAREIRAARQVRNKWYYGWGIRLTPHGWLFSVTGLDAVEIELTSGRSYRIGTDDPVGLLAAVRRAAKLDA